jgi:hypothetical protein
MGTYHGAPVAVKALDTVTQRDSQSGVALEAELSAALSHPNIVRTLAWHEANGQVCVCVCLCVCACVSVCACVCVRLCCA